LYLETFVKKAQNKINPKTIAVAASLAALQIGAVYAQNASNTLNLEEVVVTGTATRASKMKQSVSVSTLSTETIEMSAPGNSAEVLRSVPGIRAESTGGEGNANINVRGLPSPDGGARYAQYQENGLPLMLFGDINFGTADGFHRVDNNLDRLEVLRGGSAATFTSNAPGAILNFIDKTGEEKGGSIGITKGINFDRTRYDMSYGGPISEY
jgi:outer membrane receptor protein involved in Fe transport